MAGEVVQENNSIRYVNLSSVVNQYGYPIQSKLLQLNSDGSVVVHLYAEGRWCDALKLTNEELGTMSKAIEDYKVFGLGCLDDDDTFHHAVV